MLAILLAVGIVVDAQFSSSISFSPQLDLYHDQLCLSDITRVPLNTDQQLPTLTLRSRPTNVYRPRSLEAVHQARLRSFQYDQDLQVEWDRVETTGPDIEDAYTLAQLARMTGNAYAFPGNKNWWDIDPYWNSVRLLHTFPASIAE